MFSMFSLKKVKYSLISNNFPATQPPTRVFYFVYSASEKTCFSKVLMYHIFLCIKKNGTFLHINVLSFFYRIAFISSPQTTTVQLLIFCSSKQPFQPVFGNLPKNVITFPQYFDFPMILNRPLKSNSPSPPHPTLNTLLSQ